MRLYTILATLLVGLLVVALGIMAWTGWPWRDRFAECRGTAVMGAAALGGPFELIDHTGRRVSDRDLITMPTLLYFGYTFCPDVCPLDAARNAEALEILEERGILAQFAFISVDPDRDTPEVLAAFAANHHPRMIGLTGTAEEIRRAAQAFRAFYQVQNKEDAFYLIDHSAFTYLLLPKNGVVEVFPRSLSPEQLADRVACFLRKA